MHPTLGTSRLLGALVMTSLSAGAYAQGPTLTTADYAHAEKLISYNAAPLVDHDVSRVHWLDASHFVYTDHDASGDRLMQMDTATGKAAPLFDQQRWPRRWTGCWTARSRWTPTNCRSATWISPPMAAMQVSVHGKEFLCDASGAVRPSAARRPTSLATSRAYCRRTRRAKPSSATGTCGCATSPPARKPS